MISGFWRGDIDTCIYGIEALQLCARCLEEKKRVKVKKEKKNNNNKKKEACALDGRKALVNQEKNK